MTRPHITALINTFNYGRFIEEAIESVLAQDFPASDMEVLVVDDGSTDDTAERVRKFGDRVRYIRKENGGQASALSLGFAEARGEIVATLDADDLWLPTKLSRVAAEFGKHPDAGLIYHLIEIWPPSTTVTWEIPRFGRRATSFPPSAEDLENHALVPTSALAFRKQCVQKILPVPVSLVIMADRYLASLMPFVAPTVALAERLTHYRVHQENLFLSLNPGAPRQSVERRLRCEAAAHAEIENWLRVHTGMAAAGTERFVRRLRLDEATVRFHLAGAGRLEYFLHLRERRRLDSQPRPPSYRMFQVLSEILALLVGYKTHKKLRGFYADRKSLLLMRETLFPAS